MARIVFDCEGIRNKATLILMFGTCLVLVSTSKDEYNNERRINKVDVESVEYPLFPKSAGQIHLKTSSGGKSTQIRLNRGRMSEENQIENEHPEQVLRSASNASNVHGTRLQNKKRKLLRKRKLDKKQKIDCETSARLVAAQKFEPTLRHERTPTPSEPERRRSLETGNRRARQNVWSQKRSSRVANGRKKRRKHSEERKKRSPAWMMNAHMVLCETGLTPGCVSPNNASTGYRSREY